MAVTELLVLNSSYVGARDLYWEVDHVHAKRVIGYNVYRAFDYPTNWAKINREILPGNRFRDVTTLVAREYTIQQKDWVEFGQEGHYIFKLPEQAYSKQILGRAIVANGPADVTVLADGVPYRPEQVNPLDSTVALQQFLALPTGGEVSAFPILDPTTVQVWKVRYNALTNFVDIYTSFQRTYYTIVSVYEGGAEAYLPGQEPAAVRDTFQIESQDYIKREMIRRNGWIFEQVGEPCHLLFRRTQGIPCLCSAALAQARTACPDCYETKIVGGYYGPVDFLYIDPDTGATATIEEGGRKVERITRSYLGPGPLVENGDLIVRKNGDRLVISNVNRKAPQGSLVQQEYDTELLQNHDTRYFIPVVNVVPPEIFNPANKDAPVSEPGTEPVSDPKTGPQAKEWEERKDPPLGRSITWGNIQT